jgi:hypothetical protein
MSSNKTHLRTGKEQSGFCTGKVTMCKLVNQPKNINVAVSSSNYFERTKLWIITFWLSS